MCPGDSPLIQGNFLGYFGDGSWCPGDSPLTEGGSRDILRTVGGVQGIPHGQTGMS